MENFVRCGWGKAPRPSHRALPQREAAGAGRGRSGRPGATIADIADTITLVGVFSRKGREG